MDLNKAMVNIYKQRIKSERPNKVSISGNDKNVGIASEKVIEAREPTMTVESQSKRRQSRIEDIIANINLGPKTTFDQLHGIEYVQSQILRILDRFKRAISGHASKSRWPILICGSRGIGKTSIVEAAANEAKLNLIPIQLVHMVELTRNEFKESLEHLIRHSLVSQPSIVLIDDLEQIIDKEEYRFLIRGAIRRLLHDQHNLLVFCTTSSTLNEVSDIDYSFIIHLKRPALEARMNILACLREANKNLASLTDEFLKEIASNTPSFTALDLQKMLDIAETESDGLPTMKHCERAVDLVKQSLKRGTHLIGERPQVTWSDIGGLTDVRQAFVDILNQTRRPGRNCKFAGIALYGPPGCGKTMVAQAMAHEAGFNFISIKPAELVDKFLGETEKNIRRVFHEAREHEPCMIYFDEFDGLCGTRGNKDSVTSAIQTLLSEMDGFVSRGQSIILASTNRLEDIDPAMKRPGRLSKHIYVGPPDEKARRDILQVTTGKPWMRIADDFELDEWVRETEHFTGAEIDFLVAEAESKAMSEQSNVNGCVLAPTLPNADVIRIGREHFEFAMNKIRATNRELDKKTRSFKRTKIEQ